MLLTACLPICDVREFLAEDTGRLIPSPGDHGFLRGFGRLEPDPSMLVAAGHRALRLHSSPSGRASGDLGGDPFRCVERTLVYDGVATATFRLALGSPRDGHSTTSLREIVERFIEVQTVVRGRRGPTTVRLGRAGYFLAAAWAAATTIAARRTALEPWWISAGRPGFLVQLQRHELDSSGLEGVPSVPIDGARVIPVRVPFSGEGCPIWLLEIGDDAPPARATRRAAAELGAALIGHHVRREALQGVLTALAQGHLAPPPRSPASDRLQAFLNDTIRELARQRRDLPGPLIAPLASARRGTRGDSLPELVERQLRDVVQVRGNIARKTVAWLEHEGEGTAVVAGAFPGAPADDRVRPVDRAGAAPGPVSIRDLVGADDAVPSVAPEVHVPVFPALTSSVNEVEPGQLVCFTLLLTSQAPVGASAELDVRIPAGAASTALHAVVSSSDFVPDGVWSRNFPVARDGGVSDGSWQFSGRAVGDRTSYGLHVVFTASGLPAGAVSVRLARRGAAAQASPAEPCPALKVAFAGARTAIKITLEGPARFRFTLYDSGNDVAGPQLWDASQIDWYFGALESATDYAQIKEAGYGLFCDLPPAVREFCFTAVGREPLLITSTAPIAPFEMLAHSDNGPLLGLERAVIRWLDTVTLPSAAEVRVGDALAVRPNYAGQDELPHAADEERFLSGVLAGLRRTLHHAGASAELDAAMSLSNIHLLHFAGHAGGDPAYLQLEDKPIRPTYFGSSKPFMKQQPFLFVNGCRAGRAKPATPSQQSNMMNVLLQCASGAVAPLITVKSEAALIAARTFYDAIRDGKTVGEAVQQIHRLADAPGVQPAFAASWLSYVAFAPPGLSLRFV